MQTTLTIRRARWIDIPGVTNPGWDWTLVVTHGDTSASRTGWVLSERAAHRAASRQARKLRRALRVVAP